MGSFGMGWQALGQGFRKYITCHVQIGVFTALRSIISAWGPVEWVLLGWGGKLLVTGFRK